MANTVLFIVIIGESRAYLEKKLTAVAQDPLPLRLENCPLADSVVEIRFTTGVFPQAVFGLTYEKLKDLFPTVEPLPITQLPLQMLEAEPNLKFKPHYRLKNDKGFLVQVGPDVVSVSPVMPPYPGWDKYYPVIEQVFSRIFEARLFETVVRIGIRYTNFFRDQDIFDKINLKVFYENKPKILQNTVLRTHIVSEGFVNILQISNAAKFSDEQESRIGSIIDVDTISEYNGQMEDVKSLMSLIEKAHNAEKRVFWDLLNDQLKRELKPQY